jgi:integrase
VARPAKSDRRYLEQHGTKWRVVVAVPRNLHKIVGSTKLKHTLETDSLSEANRQKWAVVAELQAQIEAARNPQGQPVDLAAEAKRLASLRRSVANDDEENGLDAYITQRIEEIAGRVIGTERDGSPRYEPQREVAAQTFAGIATGQRTPIDAHRERYQAQLRVKARTLADDNRAMKYLLDWCKSENVPPFLETFSRREAIRFSDVFPELLGTKQPRTLNKYIRRLGSYWKWLEGRDEVQTNVWQGRTYTIPNETDAEKERPFTDDEILQLLNGPASPEMHDLMRIGALTGARLDAIVCLRTKDCRDGNFVFKPQKKETSSRLCPIHPDLVAIVERRTEGLGEDDSIFPEWPPAKSGKSMREHSFKASNHFTEYRRSIGVDERRDGNRRSRVNFHSFRRWFITKAEQADQPEHIIAAVVGHKRQGMTLGVYSAGPQLAQARRCVEAVKLPVGFTS